MSEVVRDQPESTDSAATPDPAVSASGSSGTASRWPGLSWPGDGPWRARMGNVDANALATGGIGVLAFVLYFWGIGGGLWANSYYAAAAKSASLSWRAVFFGSLDPGGFITVDKPPLSTALMGLWGRIFGFGPVSLVLPQAVLGLASVLLLHRLVRRWAGDLSAHLAATALAVTPVATLMFRYDNPDALLTFLCVAAAWAMWNAIETGRTRWIVLSSLLIGLGFDTKMLQVLLVLPALFVAYAAGEPNRLARRIEQLCAGAITCLVSAGWWVAVVMTWPASQRPYIGSTGDNSLTSLIFGYNGVERVLGSSQPHSGPEGVGFGRLTGISVGGQVSWLLPLAVFGLVAGLWLAGRHLPGNRAWAGWLLFGTWLVVANVVFSSSSGTFHSYYTVQLAPAIAALAGAGAVALWQLGARYRRFAWALPIVVLVDAWWAVVLLNRTSYFAAWLAWPLGLAATIGVVGLAAAPFHDRVRLSYGAAAIAAVALLIGPFAYSATTIAHPMTGSAVYAGPRPDSAGQHVVNVATRPWARNLVGFLVGHRGHDKYLVAAFASRDASPIIIASGQPVITMGGFFGGDPTPTLGQLKSLVAKRQLRFAYLPGPPNLPTPLPDPSSWSRSVTRDAQWIETHGAIVVEHRRGAGWIGTLYDLQAPR